MILIKYFRADSIFDSLSKGAIGDVKVAQPISDEAAVQVPIAPRDKDKDDAK